jgi:hypothetical protein
MRCDRVSCANEAGDQIFTGPALAEDRPGSGEEIHA